MKNFKKFVSFVLIFSFISFNISPAIALAVDEQTEVAPETIITPVVEEETTPPVEEEVAAQEENKQEQEVELTTNTQAKVNICHATGSQNNPWNALSVNENGWSGHSNHTSDFLYNGPLKQNGTPSNDGDDWCEDNASTPPQAEGSITVCKVILGPDGAPISGTTSSTFTINNDFGSPAVFTTPMVINTKLFNGDHGNDANCIEYNDLPINSLSKTTFHYQAEVTTGSSWEAPLYKDLFNNVPNNLNLNDLSSFKEWNANEDGADGELSLYNLPVLKHRTLVIINRERTAQISAAKIICPTEDLLPNWGAGAPDITAATVSEFLATHPTCHEQPGWKYEWAVDGTANPGDNVAVAGGVWQEFDENDLPEVPVGSRVWVREQIPSGYIPFSGATSDLDNPTSKNSAEFYCSTDVLNYDNYDWIDVTQKGIEYHCIAFNVPTGEQPQTATISAKKVVCDSEADLPNWGEGGPNITATTAADYVAAHPNSCHLADWTFEWSPTADNPGGDNIEVAGGTWTPFTSTVSVPTTNSVAWVREQMKPGYIPFTGTSNSAEFYCSDDVLTYDNLDLINPLVAGQTYHCVGFNVPIEQEPLQCNPQVNLLENGNFEAPALGLNTWDIIPDSNPLLKWLVSWTNPQTSGRLGLEIQNNVAGDPFEGSQHAELDGDHPVTISQTIPTIIGKTYDLSFAYSARPGRDAADNTIEVKAGGNVLGAVLSDDGTSLINTLWGTQTRSFVATSTSTTIEFKDTGSDTSFGGYLDNVDLRCKPDSTPVDGKVHIFKFVDGVQATPQNVAGVSFPMNTPTYGNAPFTLDSDGWTEGDAPYEASTSTISAGGSYTANENLTTPLVGASCDAENSPTYELEGYSTGATLELAKTGTKSLTPPNLTIDGDVYMIVWNKKCGEVEGAHTIKVHIYKYLNNDGYNQVQDNSTAPEFPMTATWDAANIGAGSGSYVLGNNHGGATLKYAADTSPMESPADYTTSEVIDGSVVVPTDSESCPEGKYRLLGYKSGDSLEVAQSATLSSIAPVYTDITIDKYVIVVNEECGDTQEETPTGSIQITKYVCPANTTVVRSANGVGGTVPGGCVLQSGKTFGYVHGSQTDANGPYPELSAPLTAGGTTASGVLTISNLPATGRYLVVETDSNNVKIPDGDILGLYCQGDGDTSDNNDNQELTFVSNDGTAQCVAYNKATVVIDNDPAQCSDESDNDKDGLNNQADPGCHTDGNVNNPESYDPNDDSESNDGAMCSDGKDNDGDQLVDSNDPGCQSGPEGSWNPNDDDETNSSGPGPTVTSGGGGGGRWILKPAGQVLGAETCGIYVDKFLRRGYKNDVEAVKKLQKFLNDYMKAGIKEDGKFGLSTEKALKKFQSKHADKILSPWGFKVPTGIFYITTQTEVNNIMCPDLKLQIPPLTPIEINPLAPKKED